MSRNEDLAWAAGFVDGEGCFDANVSVKYVTKDGQERARHYLRLSVTQKYDPLLSRLTEIFGFGKARPYPARATSSEGFKWVCNGYQAFDAATLMWPWLGERKKADFKRALSRSRKSRIDLTQRRRCGRSHHRQIQT